MAISVSVSDQVQDGYLAAGRGIAQGIQAFAQNRLESLDALSRSPDPTVSGPALERLKRNAGISEREEREFLTRSMDGLAQMGAVTMEDLNKFHSANLQGQRALFSQAVTTADLGMREAEMNRENEAKLTQLQRQLDIELQHKKSAYKAYEESQASIGQATDERQQRSARRALDEDHEAARMLVQEFDRQARAEGWQLNTFDAQQARRMTPEDAREFLLQRRDEAIQQKQTQQAGGIPVVTEIPGVGSIVRDPVTGERVPSSQIIRPAEGTGTDPGSTPPGATPATAPRPKAARDLILGGGRKGNL